MAFIKSPFAFFGQTYNSSDDSVILKTADYAGITVGGTFSCVTANTIQFSAAHGLIVGDRVRFTEISTLPVGISGNTNYYVKELIVDAELPLDVVTLSNTRGGSVIEIAAGEAADNTCQVMGPLDEVTNSESSTTATGDWRKVVFGIMEMLYWRYSSLGLDNQPTKVNVSRSSSVDDILGTMTRSYNVTVVTSTLAVEVTDE